jgi:hypothetical protein
MKLDGNNHTLAECGGAEYGDHARDNTAITGGVGTSQALCVEAEAIYPQIYKI